MITTMRTKCAAYIITASLLFLSCPDDRSSEQIAEDELSEEMSLHAEYSPDTMTAYYDSNL